MATTIALLFILLNALSNAVHAARMPANPLTSKRWWEGTYNKGTLEADQDDTALGAGTHGQVVLATMNGTQPVAVKVIAGEEERKFRKEFKLHKKCSKSPFIIKLIMGLVSDVRSNGVEYAMVMELGGVSLESLYNSAINVDVLLRTKNGAEPRLARCKYFTWSLLKALMHLHSQNVMHRDISPKNILVSPQGAVKLCDFGYATVCRAGDLLDQSLGTPIYTSPRVLREDSYGHEADYYAAGSVLWMLDQLKEPFVGFTDFYQLTHFHAKNRSLLTICRDAFMPNSVKEAINLMCHNHGGNSESVKALELFDGCDWDSDEMTVPPSVLEDLQSAQPQH